MVLDRLLETYESPTDSPDERKEKQRLERVKVPVAGTVVSILAPRKRADAIPDAILPHMVVFNHLTVLFTPQN